MTEDEAAAGGGAPAPSERTLARLHVVAVPRAGRVTRATVAAAAEELGLTVAQAAGLADAAGAVSQAIHRRGFDDPDQAAIDVEVVRVGHRVLVRLDDLGLPFAYDDEEDLDGAALAQAVAAGWVDEVHHEWRGREGNRTVLVRHLDPGPDQRDERPPAAAPPDADAATSGAPPDALPQVELTTRLAEPGDAEHICRLTWRTYGSTYQHDEYYQPARLASMLADGTQVSFITTTTAAGTGTGNGTGNGAGEVIGHTALLVEEPGALVVEAGRAMVDPRFRGHRLLRDAHDLQQRWFAANGVLAMAGAAVTAHTRSQSDGPITSVQLAFLPAIVFEGISGTDTDLREAVLGGFVAMAPIPPQTVVLPARDAEMITHLYDLHHLDRALAPASPAAPRPAESNLEVSVRADLGHAIVRAGTIGTDLDDEVRARMAAVRGSGVEVVYLDLPLDDPAVSWAADVAVSAGFIFAGVLPLERRGTDVVRYQHLGSAAVDRAAIHVKTDAARELLDYVLAQREGSGT